MVITEMIITTDATDDADVTNITKSLLHRMEEVSHVMSWPNFVAFILSEDDDDDVCCLWTFPDFNFWRKREGEMMMTCFL